MSDSGKAVFLSYASQDAEAAKRICEALRAAGVEVWFDVEGGLEHGDEWDAKIRRQIKDCVLFIAIISANTQAREEGYFRIEWELAADRAMGIASGVAFILPMVVDDTKEPDALVPDRFRKVQWTRTPGGIVSPEVQARFLKLWSHRSGVVKHEAGRTATAAPVAAPQTSERLSANSRTHLRWWTVGAALLALTAAAVWWSMRGPATSNSTVASKSSVAVPAAQDDFPKDPDLKRAMDLLNGTEANAEDYTLAEEIAQRIVTQRPTDPEAMTVMARVENAYVLRGFDRSDERIATARRYAERAMQLAPNDAEAIGAMGAYLARSDLASARELLDRAIALKPTEPFFYRQRDTALFNDSNVPSAIAIASSEKTAALFPNDALVHYELSRHYRDANRLADMERELDRSIAIRPLANALVWKARIALFSRGDPAEMKALLDRVPLRVRSSERVVFSRWVYAMATGQAELGIEALLNLTSNWIEDFDYVGPKALLTAQLLELQGKPGMARLQYEAALAEIRTRQVRTPGDPTLRILEVWVMHGLGKDAEARSLNRVALETIRRPFRYLTLYEWWFTTIPGCLLIGERATALQLIREAVMTSGAAPARQVLPGGKVVEGVATEETPAQARAALRQRFKFDPRMAPFRDDPEIVALLTDSAEVAAAPVVSATPAPLTPAREFAAKALALLSGVDATREDFALAEDFCQRALKLDSTDGEVWAAYSQVNSAFGYRGWDTSPERKEQTRIMAERAIRLAPMSVQARLAQAGAWSTFGVNRDQREKLLREVVRDQPDNQGALRFLAVTVLGRPDGFEECLALNERSAALPGGDPVALFNNARYLWQRNRTAEAYATLQRSLAQNPFSSAFVLKTVIEITSRGDLAAAEATLQQIPQSMLLEDRANYVAGLLRYCQRNPAATLEAWGAFPRDYYVDFVYDGPKGLLVGLADELDHRDAAAKIEWRAALQLVEKRIAAAPNNPRSYYYQAYLLACLGEKTTAAEALRTYEQLDGVRYTHERPMTVELALVYVRLGRFDEIFAFPPANRMARFQLDPRFDALRADPRFKQLVAETPDSAPPPK